MWIQSKKEWKLTRKRGKSPEEWKRLVDAGLADEIWDGTKTIFRLNHISLEGPPPTRELRKKLIR